jgi:hypothetical protein
MLRDLGLIPDIGTKLFTSSHLPNKFSSPFDLLLGSTRGTFPVHEATGARNCPLLFSAEIKYIWSYSSNSSHFWMRHVAIYLILFFPFAPTLEHKADFSVSWSFTDCRTPWTGDQLVARPLPKHRTTQTQKKAHTHQTSMHWVGFEATTPASERAKIVHASDRSATVTGHLLN